MGFFARWFGAKSRYNDAQLVSQVQIALAAAPLLTLPRTHPDHTCLELYIAHVEGGQLAGAYP